MAKKYQSQFKQKGFDPIKVSNASVEKIIQAGNRKVNALKEDLAYDQKQRQNVLSTMEANSKAEKQQRDRNFDLETQNRANIQKRVQANYATETANVKAQGDAQAEMYKALGSLSETANKKYRQLEQERFDRDYEDEYAKILVEGPDFQKQAAFKDQEDQLMIASAENEVGADALAATGASPLQVERVRSNSKGRQYARDEAAARFAMEAYTPWATQKLQTDNETEVIVNGRKITPMQARTTEEKAAAMYSLLTPYMKEKGLYGLKPEFLTPALLVARKGISTYISGQADIEAKTLATQRVEESKSTWTAAPSSINSSRYLADLTSYYGGDQSRALDKIFEDTSILNDAEYAAFKNSVFLGKKLPVSEDFKARVRKADIARDTARLDAFTRNDKTRLLDSKKFEIKAAEVLMQQENLQMSDVKEAQDMYYQMSGGLTSDLLKNFEAQTLSAKGSAELKTYLYGLADANKLTPEILNNVSDIKLRNDAALKGAAESYAAIYETKPAQKALASISNLVSKNGTLQAGDGSLDPASTVVLLSLENQFKARVNELVNAGEKSLSVSEATAQALKEVKQTFDDGKVDPNSPYYYQINGADKGYNISKFGADPSTQKQIDERILEVNKAFTTGNALETIEKTPNLLFSQEAAIKLASDYYTSGYSTPSMVQQIAKQINESPISLINAQLRSYNMPELPIPPSMRLLDNVTPEVRSGLLNAQTESRSVRFLSQTGAYNEAAIPNGYGTTITEASETYNIPPSILAGLIEAESSWNPQAVSTAGARGLGQFMPGTASEMGVDVNDPKSSIMGAAKYLRYMMDTNGFDIKRAIYAYNAGPNGGVGLTKENADYYPKVMRGAAKYGYGAQSWVEPSLLRAGMEPKVAYIAGNIGGGPYYTGEHLDVKLVGGGYFDHNELDDYVEVEDPDYGRVPLSRVGVTGDFQSHTSRNSHGIDFGTKTGSRLYLKNGAQVSYRGDSGDGNGDVMAFTLPDGREFQFLHGTLPQQ